MAQPTSAESPAVLRVLTYNIHHGEGTDGELNLSRIAKTIRATEPHVVALQEVDNRVARSNLVDQASELAATTGLVALFGRNIDLQGGGYGNAILTRLPIIDWENKLLPRHRNGEQRGVLMARLRWRHADGTEQELRLLATHFDHRQQDSERVASAELVNSIAEQSANSPMILAGDLNATRDSRVLATLSRQWTIAGPEQFTIPVDFPNRQIDFVLYRPAATWFVAETRVLDESIASDHRALLVTLQAR